MTYALIKDTIIIDENKDTLDTIKQYIRNEYDTAIVGIEKANWDAYNDTYDVLYFLTSGLVLCFIAQGVKGHFKIKEMTYFKVVTSYPSNQAIQNFAQAYRTLTKYSPL